ncbi:hypothetical protein YYG_00578 [Plasmodium vinckei petteri]|uniref:Ribosome-binding factor A n=1 Tax=Plasmodium vinckei petteri TaxID=138298 RepID=W7AME6_PLAVN|nr:hypothetical protein YYG_00578 [Plasmodium vinckei petteri]CAD2114313.1 conserved Plasmodium protein, unknown function [Plasmodium vinckei petteri]
MRLLHAERLVLILTKRKGFFFSTFRKRTKNEKYDDLETKHLYWSINNLKKEYLNDDNDNFLKDIENLKIEEDISDIVGIKNSIPENREINEQTEKYLLKQGCKNPIEKDQLKEINKIFNPSLKILTYQENDYSKNLDKLMLQKALHNNMKINKIAEINEQHKNGSSFVESRNNDNVKNHKYDNNYMSKKMEKFKRKENCGDNNEINNDFHFNEYDNNVLEKNEKTENADISKAEEENYNFKIENNKKDNSIFDYESLKGKSLYQDLTHDEYEYVNKLYLKKCDVDRKIRWFKMSNMLNPIKEAKSIINSLKLSKDEEKEAIKQQKERYLNGRDQDNEFPIKENIKPYYEDDGMFGHKIQKICEQNKYDEIVSRIRMKIRKEKLENSKIIKEKIPNVARHILDPIKYHVNRRKVRVEKLLHTHLEQLLNCNNSYFKFYLLKGLHISIHHLEMKSNRSICKIVYSLLNKDVTHEMIQEKLDKVAFILRKLLARKLQLGYTPPLKFVPLKDQQETSIKNIQYYKLYAKYNYPQHITNNREANQKMIDFYNQDISGF